jgi:hypothetical protein
VASPSPADVAEAPRSISIVKACLEARSADQSDLRSMPDFGRFWRDDEGRRLFDHPRHRNPAIDPIPGNPLREPHPDEPGVEADGSAAPLENPVVVCTFSEALGLEAAGAPGGARADRPSASLWARPHPG